MDATPGFLSFPRKYCSVVRLWGKYFRACLSPAFRKLSVRLTPQASEQFNTKLYTQLTYDSPLTLQLFLLKIRSVYHLTFENVSKTTSYLQGKYFNDTTRFLLLELRLRTTREQRQSQGAHLWYRRFDLWLGPSPSSLFPSPLQELVCLASVF